MKKKQFYEKKDFTSCFISFSCVPVLCMSQKLKSLKLVQVSSSQVVRYST